MQEDDHQDDAALMLLANNKLSDWPLGWAVAAKWDL